MWGEYLGILDHGGSWARVEQGQICSCLSFPSDRDKHWDKRFRETESEQKRGERTWEGDQEIDTIRDRVRHKNRDTEKERYESET